MAASRHSKQGRGSHGSSSLAKTRLLCFFTACALAVTLTIIAVVHVIDSTSPSGVPQRQARQLLADATASNSQVTLDPEKTASILWAGNKDAAKLRIGLVRPEVVSWAPRIVHLHNFLSLEECEALIKIGRPSLTQSTVVDSSTGKSIASTTRTSSGMFLNEGHRRSALVKTVEERISTFTMTPVENGEMLQILRYLPGQYYKAHPDYFQDQVNLRRGGQRVATVLMYLEAAEEGGETHFPMAGGHVSCFCGGKEVKGVCVRPQKGDAVLFWSTKLNGEVDPESMHESCPVLKGEKWSCTKWIRQREFH